jgi:GTP-binding protein
MHITSAEFIKGVRGTDPILSDGVPQFAFVGRSNVGKSSVINALMNRRDLVKVSDRPGKTKEINFFNVNKKYYFVDLPGYGYARLGPDEREKLRKLILWYLMASGARPYYVILILDIKAGCTEFDKEMIGVLREYGHPYIIVANKVDKVNQKELSQQLAQIRAESGEEDIVLCSTFVKNGTGDLEDKMFA